MKNENLTVDEMLEFQQKTGLNAVPEWAWERVIPMEQIENYHFFKYVDNSTSVQNVPLKNIVGTDHASYNDRPWVRMLLNLKRREVSTVSQAYNAIDNPRSPHDTISFNKYGQHYIIGAGNHRSCLAKFGDREFVEGRVTEYVLDVEAANAYKYLCQYFKGSLQGSSHYEFDSDFIRVMTCTRNELIAFYHFFYSWNYSEVRKLKARTILSNKIHDFFFGWISRKVFGDSKTCMDELREKKVIRWSETQTEANKLIALLEVKLRLDSN